MKIMNMEPNLINDSAKLDEWDGLWAVAHEARLRVSRARQAKEPITLDMMQAYNQLRNNERQFFFDNFFVQHEGL